MKPLVQAGLVVAEKSGRWVYYRVGRDAFAEVVAYLSDYTGEASARRSSQLKAASSVSVS